MIERPIVQVVIINLPPPISANAIWRSFSGRNIKSKRYREWIIEAGKMIDDQRPGRIDGTYGLKIVVPLKCRIDLDNVPKAISDIAQAHGIIGNDRDCARLTVERGEGTETQAWFISTRHKEGE